MPNNKLYISVDRFRLMGSLHTTTRQLRICSEIIRQLGSKQLPKEMLIQLLIRWSSDEELKNQGYKNSKGKLTDSGKPTTSIGHYLDLCNSLGLITHFNSFFSCSRLAAVLIHFLNSYKSRDTITKEEKLFYLFQLLSLDADGILYIMQQLYMINKSQIELQEEFKEEFNQRLLAKQESAPPIIKNQVSEKYRLINFIWKKPEKYAEHILIPRCEWLTALGIVEISKQGNYTMYSLTENGRCFFETIPCISAQGIRDINEDWLFSQLFTSLNILLKGNNHNLFNELNTDQRIIILGATLEKALKIVKTSNSFRIPLYDTLIFTCIELFNQNIIINFSDILGTTKNGLTYNGRTFTLKQEGRINESYITTIK